MAYHLSPNGPRRCEAKVADCPYAKAGEPHFETMDAATGAYEERMSEAFGAFDPLKKSSSQRRLERRYRNRENILAIGKAVKASAPARKAAKAVGLAKDAPTQIKATLVTRARQALLAIATVAVFVSTTATASRDRARLLRERYENRASKARAEHRALVQQFQEALALSEEAKKERKAVAAALGARFKLKPVSALRVGDRLANGSIVTHLKPVEAGTAITARDPKSGRFVKQGTFTADSRVETLAPKRSLASSTVSAAKASRIAAVAGARRAQAATGAAASQIRTRAAVGLTVTSQRVALAGSLQRQAFDALRGVDRAVLATAPRDDRVDS